jgi:uncharacterized membrane protein YbhN (UPF0104 family)
VAYSVLAAVLLVEVVLIAPYFQGALSDLYRSDLGWLTLAVVAQLLSMGAFARVQNRMLVAGGIHVPMRRMVALTYVANAVSVTLPGGVALSASYVFKRLRSWGATGPAAGFTVLASAVLSTLSFALLTVVCAAFAGSGGISSLLVLGGAAVVVIVALATSSPSGPAVPARQPRPGPSEPPAAPRTGGRSPGPAESDRGTDRDRTPQSRLAGRVRPR